jgi:hypothetical protein
MKIEIIAEDSLKELQDKVNRFFNKNKLKKCHIINIDLKDVAHIDMTSKRYIYSIVYEKKN